ncbi:hypothetical protein [Natronospira bacteriovora]|uniref:Secreted protein n=1 Tax=Natronospira bacteriovora TaxID=3069753 RepID=A0ABU0W3A2_9GAMM|nr:hypothetical protein [Natronospira sp. AB-CW4]MDQ2068501.1 hypothetical protein [Natronospira sp. AB-CW4]
MRRATIFIALFAILPFAGQAWAACSVSDFGVDNLEISIDQCRGRNCPRLNITGTLVNNCGAASGARIEIEARNGSGRVVDSVDGWPGRTSNLSPGERVDFDLSGMMSFERSMEDFSVSIVEVRVW